MDARGPIRDLYNEHNGITVMLEILHAVTAKLTRGDHVPKSDLVGMVEFISVFADKCHHGKEEFLLIPEMQKSKRSDKRLLAEIIGEHKTGRDIVAGMRASLEGYKYGQPEVYHFAANANAYIDLLMEHIRKENVIMFPQAAAIFDATQLEALMGKFDHMETDIIGAGESMMSSMRCLIRSGNGIFKRKTVSEATG